MSPPALDFRSLPARPDHPRYLKRFKDIDHLLRQRKDRLVEEGMVKARATAADDFWFFCRFFTSFSTYKIRERGHPMDGQLWADHPYFFWLCRIYQEVLVEPQEGWVWVKIHRLGLKTTTALALCLWVHSIDETAGEYPRALGLSRTIGLWTHKEDLVGSAMSRGVLADMKKERVLNCYPQFRNLKEGSKSGYVVDRPPGPREQSLQVQSIMTSPESVHPDIYLFDDVITAKLRGNVGQIAQIGKNISAVALLMTPDCPVIVFNTPKDKADPLMARERDGGFARVITQAATYGGDFTKEVNLHTKKFYDQRRRAAADDSLYFCEYELQFHERAGTLFTWSWMREYDQSPEEVAAASPFIHIIVDGAGGKKGSDFTVIRVVAWTAHNAWANLDLIRERIGSSKTMQVLLGRDRSDPTTAWIESSTIPEWRPYCPGGLGVVERWMRIDPKLTLWFDDHGNAGWRETFQEHCRLRRISFGGKLPTVKAWPEVHILRHGGEKASRVGYSKRSKIQALEPYYQQGRVAYPRRGFGHGSFNGLVGFDKRDTRTQFREDEFERMALGEDIPYDDMLDTEALLVLPQAQTQMRRPAAGEGVQLGGIVFPSPTTSNPWGLPGGGQSGTMNGMHHGRTWVSLL